MLQFASVLEKIFDIYQKKILFLPSISLLFFGRNAIIDLFGARACPVRFESRENFAPREDDIMSRVCSICGKGQTAGNNVSHSNRKTKRAFKANVQKVSFVKDGKVETDYVCTRCLKSDKIERV